MRSAQSSATTARLGQSSSCFSELFAASASACAAYCELYVHYALTRLRRPSTHGSMAISADGVVGSRHVCVLSELLVQYGDESLGLG